MRYRQNNNARDIAQHSKPCASEFFQKSLAQGLFLPPYSPNLNLIERLWRFLKKIVLYNLQYELFADFKAAILKLLC
jgi:transposase